MRNFEDLSDTLFILSILDDIGSVGGHFSVPKYVMYNMKRAIDNDEAVQNVVATFERFSIVRFLQIANRIYA